MARHVIRRFAHNGRWYAHTIDYDTDKVFLEHVIETGPDILTFDPHCNVTDAAGKHLGRFRSEYRHWIFESDTINFIGEGTHLAEGLLDTEVTLSKLYLTLQQEQPNEQAA